MRSKPGQLWLCAASETLYPQQRDGLAGAAAGLLTGQLRPAPLK